ncbi:ribonuclease domain-containing protein [Paenibacillus sp. GCM10012306]|uniref:ribonuclease domain-containing protein n=1 Tax=Paenibacillus sp. GCM10012306 TaxID=3317342 RepID=UPI00361BDDAE
MFEVLMQQLSRWSRSWLAVMAVILVIALTGCGEIINSNNNSSEFHEPTPTSTSQTAQPKSTLSPKASNAPKAPDKSQAPLTGFKEVSDYIRQHHTLPDNFITKKEAEGLGWVASKGNLNKVAPGKSIGGDRFGNREGLLPKAKNRIWYEADINYKKGSRGADRILYSNDGLIYMTTDHYKSFTDITKEGSVSE